ncbi:MAG: hypothetical protein QM831_27175 [Kofleriaceae bacterium]
MLAEFGRSQENPWRVMRELIAHDGWFAPSAPVRNQLWLFTSEAELAIARTRMTDPLNIYSGPKRGVAVFEQLPNGLRTVEINPSLDPEQGWFLAAGAVAIARGMAQAIALSRAHEHCAPDLVDRLIAHERYTLLVDSFGRPAVSLEEAGMRNPVMVFTAPDAIAPLRAENPELDHFTSVVLTGEQLWSAWPSYGSDGIAMFSNPTAREPWPMTADCCLSLYRRMNHDAGDRHMALPVVS